MATYAIRLNCCLLLHHDEFKVRVKKIYDGKNCPQFNQLIILELGNTGGTMIKPIQLLEWFSERVKSISRSMEKAWPSMTLSEYPCSAILASLGVQVVLISAYLSHEKIELSLDIAFDEICKLIK